MLKFDFSEHLNMEPWVSDDKTFNLNVAMFQTGSYFGDNGVLDKKNSLSASRNFTVVCN